MINEAINKLAEKQNLTGAETIGAFGEIMSGEATNAQIAAFITAMRMKGETIEEITACAKVLREKCTHIDPGKDVLDIVGTGGDCANTFNISTTSSFVIAAAGVPVAKHGNRSMSQHFLYVSDIHVLLHQIGRKGMPEHMRCNIYICLNFTGIFMYHAPG